VVGHDQTTARSQEHTHPISVDVKRRAQTEFLIGQIFPSVGIHHDILGGAEKSDQKGGTRHHPGISGRIGQCECDDGAHKRQLDGHQPASPAAEKRQGEAVHERGPEKLERVRKPDQRH
jgi:hypothetical protein